MSKEIKPLMEVMQGSDFVPGTHNPDFLVVVPFDASTWHGRTPAPFASIIAIHPNEMLPASPRPCIHVNFNSGAFLYTDNLYWSKHNQPLIVSKIACPELTRSLRMASPRWAKLTDVGPDETPHVRIMNWHSGDHRFKIDPCRLTPAFIVLMLHCWEHMEKNRWHWPERWRYVLKFDPLAKAIAKLPEEVVSQIDPRGKFSDSDDKEASLVDDFRKYCNSLGFKQRDMRKFDNEMTNLRLCLQKALFEY